MVGYFVSSGLGAGAKQFLARMQQKNSQKAATDLPYGNKFLSNHLFSVCLLVLVFGAWNFLSAFNFVYQTFTTVYTVSAMAD